MDDLSKIKQSIIDMRGGATGGMPVVCAGIKSVDGETCAVEIDGVEFSDVRLRAVVNGENSKLLITPKTGSYVLCVDLSGGKMTDLAVLIYSEIEKIDIDVDDTIIINGGENHGMVKVEELDKRLKSLEKAFNDHTHIATTTATVGPSTTVGTITVNKTASPSMEFQNGYKDYENDKVKH